MLGMFSRSSTATLRQMAFKHYKDLQNMTFNTFNNLRLLITVRHVCSWQHQSISEKAMGIKVPLYGVFFPYGKKLAL